ncbi:MAG: helix-turn-helix domain-containing protein [Polyangiales bacterium]
MRSKKPKPPPLFAPAMRNARRAMILNQATVAEEIGVSAVTISRWEQGDCSPNGAARLGVVKWANGLVSPHREAIFEALGVMLPTATATPTATTKADKRRAIDAAVLATADALDVGPRSLRAALVQLIDAVESAGAGIGELREASARGAKVARGATG